MAAGGSMGGLGSTRTGQQPSQLNQQSAQPSSGGYQPSPLMFGQAYTPPPPAAPAPAPRNMNFNQRVSSFGGGFNGLVAAINNPGRNTAINNPVAQAYGIGNNTNNATAASPQMPYQPVQAPAPQSPMYQTPETPPSGYRPSASAGQFYQPIYQSQYQNYNTGNPYGVSQYGMGYQSPFSGGYQPSFMGGYQQPMMGFNPYGGMGGYGQSPMGALQSLMGGYNTQRMGGYNPQSTPSNRDYPSAISKQDILSPFVSNAQAQQQLMSQRQGRSPMTMDIQPGDMDFVGGMGMLGGFGMNQGGIASLLKK